MDAIIIGGGIGGLATALALRKVGITARVYEATSTIREVGAGLTLWSNAIHALHWLGLEERLNALSVPEIQGGIVTWRGEPLMHMDAADMQRRFGTPAIVVHRAELQAALLDAVGDGVVQTGQRCVGISQDAAGVRLAFADGHEDRAALVIGADGIHSVVRQQLFDKTPPRYSGYGAWRAVVPFDLDGVGHEVWGRGARFGFVPMSEGRVYWFATHNAPETYEDPSPAARHAAVCAAFRGWLAPVEDIVRATPADAILYNPIYDRPPLSHWSEGRVTLLGDAAHPMTPNLGQGACQALEDAVVLARSLQAEPDIHTALKTYAVARISRTRRVVAQSRRIGWAGQWHNPLLVAARGALLKRLSPATQMRQLDWILGYDPTYADLSK